MIQTTSPTILTPASLATTAANHSAWLPPCPQDITRNTSVAAARPTRRALMRKHGASAPRELLPPLGLPRLTARGWHDTKVIRGSLLHATISNNVTRDFVYAHRDNTDRQTDRRGQIDDIDREVEGFLSSLRDILVNELSNVVYCCKLNAVQNEIRMAVTKNLIRTM